MLTFTDRSNRRLILVCASLLAAAAVAGVVVTSFGATGALPLIAASSAAAPAAHGGSLHLLRALIALLLLSSLLGMLCRWIHQPQVIGEILAGICLGPSVLGHIAPTVRQYVMPPDVTPQLETLSQVGVILFMFLVGLELDTSVLRTQARSALAISHASIVAPFILGSVAAIWLYPSLGTSTTSFVVFALFLGISLSVTAFPVLARILTDNALSQSPMGIVALTCAAIDDVTAWCLLALVVGVAKADTRDAVVTCASTVLYIAVLFCFARPAIARWVRARAKDTRFSRATATVVFVALLSSALVTERIGIHALFGAFLLGAMIPHDSSIAGAMKSRLHDLVVVLFMPAFYALTGTRTQLALLEGWKDWLTCGVIILLACLGKFGGSYFAARAVGVERRDAAAIGILMNTRGLMELVVLNLGLDLGVISPTLFAMMVVMALVTTFLTSPLLRLVRGSAARWGTEARSLVFTAASAGPARTD